MKTHQLEQYAVVTGEYCYLYRRAKGNAKYRSPRPAGIMHFDTEAAAVAFKRQYDKPCS